MHRKQTGVGMVQGVCFMALIVLVGTIVLMLVVETGELLLTHEQATLLAQNAAEILAKRANWLGVENGVASPQIDTFAFIKHFADVEGLPQPLAQGFSVNRSGQGRLLFTVKYSYLACVFGVQAPMQAVGVYDASVNPARIVLAVDRKDKSSIRVPGYGLNSGTAVGHFTPGAKPTTYYFWNAASQQIESRASL